jgi:hypothetical protein
VRGGIVAVDPAAQHGDGQATGFQRPPVRLAVDAAGEAADDDESRTGELASQRARDTRSVARARAGADDRDGRPGEHLGFGLAAEEESGRRIVDRPQQARKAGIRARQPAESEAGEPGDVATVVEPA